MQLVRVFVFLSFLCCFSPVEGKEKRKVPLASLSSSSIVPTIVIDAGHGGTDLGTKSKKPFCEEKRVCLQTARLVKKYLEQLGYHVVMTRVSDAFIPLSRRVQVAAQSGGSVFVSVHYNSAPAQSAQGVEIFFFNGKEEKSRTIASKRLAESVLPRILRRTSAVSRGVKSGNYYVLRENTIPAIIVEGGFISNPDECSLLKTFTYQDLVARGIADGIDQYFKM